ncbi:MAG: NADPH-dependent glutamate synthase [Actinobacteria bacterium]|nr:MAG: NADPH-dependent glutamate synthase [Actinomycetota bacterium]
MAMPRTEMPEVEAEARARSFREVNTGYTTQLAMLEASRCLRCPRPKCIEGCPVGVRIDEFIGLVAAGDIAGAAEVIAADNSLPAVCGRVCPQESQCEAVCVLGAKGRPIAIGHLERFVADEMRLQPPAEVAVAEPTGKRVAIVGSGPAGLACASDLIRLGHAVTVYEALHEPGGVLVYGIPEYRLPKEIVAAEIDRLRDLGVQFVVNAPIGKAETIDDLLADHDAVFIAVGAGLPRFLGIQGENLIGVYSANEFLTRVNLMRAYLPDAETPVYDLRGRRAVVIGGGNTAMDAVRTALRLGAADAAILYRRTEAEMPARAEEVRHAREEGVRFEMLTAPIELIGEEGWLRAVRVQRMELGDPDEDGRRRPVPIAGSEVEIPADVAIIAVGNEPNPLLRKISPDLEHTPRGTIAADPETGRTSKAGVFAGGDIVTGGATVILAMGAGRRAAAAIDAYLENGAWGG